MSDAAAAFFANKKRKKKAFSFNANLIDVSSVGQTTHVGAPALSKDVDGSSGGLNSAPAQSNSTSFKSNVVSDNEQEGPSSGGGNNAQDDDQQWDDAAVVAPPSSRNKTASGNSSAPEVLDMKSLAQSKGSDNISEKLRVEETKAKLAAAREGMEREAARAKAEKERKEREAREKEAAKAAATGGGGSIWVSPRLRAAQQHQASTLPKIRLSGMAAKQQQLDTSNEELFPDLASAEKIMEQKEKSTAPGRGPKKTPVGGGASWATKTNSTGKAPAKPPMKNADTPKTAPKEDKKTPVRSEEAKPAETPPAPSPTETKEATPAKKEQASPPSTPAVALPNITKKSTKKKKKDLSSFKPGAAS